METVYLVSFLAGATLMVCQFLLSLVGLGGHHEAGDSHELAAHDAHCDQDASHDHHDSHHESLSSWFVSLLTFRTLVAALTFFGLAGLAGTQQWGDGAATRLISVAAGAGAMVLVAGLMRTLSRLRAEGTVRMDRAVGKGGTVYLPIPAGRAGTGKVLLNLQNRTVECQAVTAEKELPTGAPVVVVAIVGPDTVEVAPVSGV
ncbi:MAG TPA: hypothetical protein VKU02_31105 [Gemmataceae bacterium]|nr:hypothetical protein [Gemmataceae bacterium]